ncbi:hypothetical protein ACEPAH_6492 [Sanghuangporus vaninii]
MADEDVDVVDVDGTVEEPTQIEASVDSQTFFANPPRTIAESVMRSSRRRSTPPVGISTRSTTSRPKGKPKLKLKLSEKAQAAMASGTSFLGPYDRELDSDDEDLAFEEQFILRMPPGEDLENLRKMVAAREMSPDVWFKFKDSRRAVFHIGNSLYSAKLVDLPCLIESQKTLDNRQMFKVADICQMLVVEDKIESEDVVANQRGFNLDEFIYPHGITPPLHHVRKRRFRNRINRRTIETVEQEVERLLDEDARATHLQYTVLDNVNPDLSDSEFLDQEDRHGAESQLAGIGTPTPGPGADGESLMDEDDEGEIDEELAAELDMALGDEAEDGDEDGEDGDDEEDESDEEDEDEDEDDEAVQARRLLNEEIRDLEAAVAKKKGEIASSANPIIKRRFEGALRKLQADLDSKILQRDELSEQQRMRKEGFVPPRDDLDPNDDEDGGVMDLDYMSSSASSSSSSSIPLLHECPPECPVMLKVIDRFKGIFDEADFTPTNEDFAYVFMQSFHVVKEMYDDGNISEEMFDHVLILIERYCESDEYESNEIEELPELKGPTVTGGEPLKSSYIRGILSSIGCSPTTCEDMTNDEAASILLENMERVRILAWQGKLDRLDLCRIRCFAMDNIEAMENNKRKKAKKGKSRK